MNSGFSYVITASKPDDIMRDLKELFKRRQDIAKSRLPQASGIKGRAKITSEIATLSEILVDLDHVKIEGPLAEARELTFDDAVEMLADSDAGGELDESTKQLIRQARIVSSLLLKERMARKHREA